jgi:hypothetical protein
LPIVQSSTTKQVSIANLTAGRSVSAADYVMSTGNLVPTTAAKGINFTANTPAAGMTSQLLNWYEEGTFSPSDVSGAGLTFSNVIGTYTRIGRQVTCNVQFQYPVTANGSQARISLPFTAQNSTAPGGGVFYVNTPGTGLSGAQPNVTQNQSYFVLSNVAAGVAYLNATASGNYFRGTINYVV